MVTLAKALNKYSDGIWKPIVIELDGQKRNAIFFDKTKFDKEEFEQFIEDCFNDGMPDDLNLKKKMPFLVAGFFGNDFTEGNLGIIRQPTHMLFVDVENGTEEKQPVYCIEIDGTAIEDTFQKIADDIGELKIESGWEE
jgi:hypothetical protein